MQEEETQSPREVTTPSDRELSESSKRDSGVVPMLAVPDDYTPPDASLSPVASAASAADE